MPRKHARPAARKARAKLRERMPPASFKDVPWWRQGLLPHTDIQIRKDFFSDPLRAEGLKLMHDYAERVVISDGSVESFFGMPARIVKTIPRGQTIKRAPGVWTIDPPENCESVEITIPEGYTLGGEAKKIIGLPSGRNVRVEFNRDMTAYTVFKDGKVFKTGEC